MIIMPVLMMSAIVLLVWSITLSLVTILLHALPILVMKKKDANILLLTVMMIVLALLTLVALIVYVTIKLLFVMIIPCVLKILVILMKVVLMNKLFVMMMMNVPIILAIMLMDVPIPLHGEYQHYDVSDLCTSPIILQELQHYFQQSINKNR